MVIVNTKGKGHEPLVFMSFSDLCLILENFSTNFYSVLKDKTYPLLHTMEEFLPCTSICAISLDVVERG